MSEQVISTALLTIASVIAVAALVHTVYPSIMSMSSSFLTATSTVSDRIETDLKIIYVVNQSINLTNVWVKNIGKNSIGYSAIEMSDVFFGPEGNFERIPYDNSIPLPNNRWNYTIENNNDNNYKWDPLETLKITIRKDNIYATSPRDYYLKIVLYNGVWDEDHFSI